MPPAPEIHIPEADELTSVVHGDARKVLAGVPSGTFDHVICDPPYGIALTKNEIAGPRWDQSRIAFDPAFWAEVARVLKPGANLLAFGHPRTFARMSVAIEDAGFAIVDTLAWIHGQGYPAGFRHLDRELDRLGAPDPAAEGWGNMLRPAFEPIVLARNLGARDSLPATIAAGGVGGLNVDACRIPAGKENRSRIPGRVNASATWRVSREDALKSTPPPKGRLPSNVLLQHSPACASDSCADGCPVASVRDHGLAARGRKEDATRFYQAFLHHPKAPPHERPEVGGISGATVKPLGVMDWLVQLSTRPGQLVLDPFAGTGATLQACAEAGVRCVGIEQEATMITLIEHRLRTMAATPSAD